MSLIVFDFVAAGDGDCVYYALALKLVVALAAEPLHVRAAFIQHAEHINAAILDDAEIAKTTLPCGAQTSEGCNVLVVRCVTPSCLCLCNVSSLLRPFSTEAHAQLLTECVM